LTFLNSYNIIASKPTPLPALTKYDMYTHAGFILSHKMTTI